MPTLEELRLRKPYTQAELAEAAGVSESTVWLIERGRHRTLRPRIMRALADALGALPSQIAEFRASLKLPPLEGAEEREPGQLVAA